MVKFLQKIFLILSLISIAYTLLGHNTMALAAGDEPEKQIPPVFYRVKDKTAAETPVIELDINKKSATEHYLPQIVNNFSMFLAGLAVIIIIITGIQYMIAQGEAEAVTKAHKSLLYSVMALFLIMFGYGMVYLILQVLP